ncbi:hypothetical protein AB205_0099940, partial [Aquarana catesbeiana]
MSDIAFTLSKLNFVSSRVVYFFMILNMPALPIKGNFYLMCPKKMLYNKHVGLFKNPFINAHVIVLWVKILLIN